MLRNENDPEIISDDIVTDAEQFLIPNYMTNW